MKFKRKALAWKTAKKFRGGRARKAQSFPIFAKTPSPFRKRIGKGLKQATSKRESPFFGEMPLKGDGIEVMRKARDAKPLLTLKTRELRGQADFNRLADEIMSNRPGMTMAQAEKAIASHLKRKYPLLKQKEILMAQKGPLERYWREKGEKWRAWKKAKTEWFKKEAKEAPGKIARGVWGGLGEAEERIGGRGPFAGEPYAKPLDVEVKPKVDVVATPKGVSEMKPKKPVKEQLKEMLGVEHIKEAARRIKVLPGRAAEKLVRRGPPEIIVESEREPIVEVEEAPHIEVVVEGESPEEEVEE